MSEIHRSIIKQIRKLRGISQKQLGDLVGSQSTVSRIENNQTEPSDYTLYLLCKTLNISFDEYFCSVFGLEESNIEKLETILLHAYVRNDRQQLQQLWIFYRRQYRDKKMNRLIFHQTMMIKATICRLDTNKHASISEKNKLINYFFDVQEWQYYDLRLLTWTLNLLDIKQIKPYITHIMRCNQLKKISNCVSIGIGQMLISALSSSIISQERQMTSYLLTIAESWQIHQSVNFNFKTWLLFLTGIVENRVQHQGKQNEKIKHAYRIATYLYSDSTIGLFDRFLKSASSCSEI